MKLFIMKMADNAHHGSRPLYGEFAKRETTALPVRRPNDLLFVLFKMISYLESESPIFSQYDSHYIKNMKWCGNLYIKLRLPLVSQLEEQQGQIVKTHQAEEKMIVKKREEKNHRWLYFKLTTYLSRNEEAYRTRSVYCSFRRCSISLWKGICQIIVTKKIIVKKKDYCDKKMSKVNKWWQEMCTWHRRTTRRQLGRARVEGWSGLGRGGYGAGKLGVAFLEEYNVRISSWIAYDRHAQ